MTVGKLFLKLAWLVLTGKRKYKTFMVFDIWELEERKIVQDVARFNWTAGDVYPVIDGDDHWVNVEVKVTKSMSV